MIYITGDKHGDYHEIFDFCNENKTSEEDIMIILGDAGINYYLNYRDIMLKNSLLNLPITLFCIHGNHEERPENIPTYKTKLFNGGVVYYEDNYPNILFAKNGEIYDFDGLKTIVIGGAYSIDKEYRIKKGYRWYASEQLTGEEKEKIKQTMLNNSVDVILTHTCPYKYLPYEMFLHGVDEEKVDHTMELFLDEVETTDNYQKWYCGHFHTDKSVDKLRFMMHDIEKFKIKEKALIKKK